VSLTTSLQQKELGRTEGRVVLAGTLARNTASAVSDELSRKVLAAATSCGKTAREISVEQAVPLSSCYRRMRELVEQGLLLVERVVVTADGKRYALYRSSFRTVEMLADSGEVSVSAELNSEVAEKFRQKWFYFAYPDAR
jgi:hypothetical protein